MNSREELQRLSISELRQRAASMGVDEDEIEDERGEFMNLKATIIELILEGHP